MDKLFKHIEGNRFELNEEISKDSTYKISKMEEDQALQYIRKILIPHVVDYYHQVVLHQEKYVNYKNISLNLKKVKHKIGTINSPDIIYYSSTVKLSGNRNYNTFKFITYKDKNGKIQSGYNTGLFNMGGYFILSKDNKSVFSGIS